MGGILDELNLDETTSLTNAEGKLDAYLLERKMALDSIQDGAFLSQDESQMAADAAEVERQIEEIKRSEAGGAANLPLEKLLTSLGSAGGATDEDELDEMEGEIDEDAGVGKKQVAGFTPAFTAS